MDDCCGEAHAPTITIVVPVLHSLPELGDCLTSIDKLDYPPERFRVAVVDCRVVDGVDAFCQKLFLALNSDVTQISLPDDAPQVSPEWLIEARMNEGRNAAVEALPAEIYVFTEDDCTFPCGWLRRIAGALTGTVAAVGGPEILPDGMSWFAQSLDAVLNSRIGAGRQRHGTATGKHDYYPRKQNMAYSAQVFESTAPFPEDLPVSGELHLAMMTRQLGLEVAYLEDNPVLHQRINTLSGFRRLSAFTAAENVRLLSARGRLWSSAYGYVIAVGLLLLGVLAAVGFNVVAAAVFGGFTVLYLAVVLAFATSAAVRAGRVMVFPGSLVLCIAHHSSILLGSLFGLLAPRSQSANTETRGGIAGSR
jgi:hypothetical protein